jgi:hypothetical protein
VAMLVLPLYRRYCCRARIFSMIHVCPQTYPPRNADGAELDGAERFWPLIGNAIKIAQSVSLNTVSKHCS